mgnify:CR=1 FL=1
MYNRVRECFRKEDAMEFGLIPKLEQFQFNSQQNIQTINESRELQNLKPERETEEVISYKGIKDSDEIKEAKQQTKIDTTTYQEFTLTNLNFGYNNSSKDFFVKVQRGELEHQYPTDEMMKLKAHLMQLSEAS